MQTRRVAVTGIGSVSCIGNSADEMWQNLLAGKSGIAPISKFDPAGFATTIAGEVRNLAIDGLSAKEARRMSETVKYAYASACEAVAQSKISGSVAPERFGCIFSTATGGLDAYDRACDNLRNRGPAGVSALYPDVSAQRSRRNACSEIRSSGTGIQCLFRLCLRNSRYRRGVQNDPLRRS